ncbi:hypothetical protein V1527DRAFT_474973 [Lipomyces starkeyi]
MAISRSQKDSIYYLQCTGQIPSQFSLVAMNETLEVSPPPVYRPRRAHKKSRNGCVRCKQRKTKCDEATPRCSPCAKRGLGCQYRQKSPESGSIMELRFVSHFHREQLQRRRQSAGSLPSTSSPTVFQIPSPIPGPGPVDKLYSCAYADEILDWTELELLSHYLTHTSSIIPFDVDDLYALRVGITNLAFRSKPLMSSILALAAVCKSHDLLQQPHRDRHKILDLLVLADRHHRASLLQVQIDLPNAGQYEYVLANATLMVLYASSSHCIRIRLAETQTKDEPLPREFIPAQSQWISLIRAAHLAFVGLLNDHSETADIGEVYAELPPIASLLGHSQAASINETISPENGPTERTRNLLFPILASSSGPALKVLRAKALAIWKIQDHTMTPSGDFLVEDASLQACFTSLDIFAGIMSEVFASDALPPVTSSQKQDGLDSLSLGRLSAVSGWLRCYVGRVTSSTTGPRPLRRVIMAFLNKVPAEYLNLVQTTLDSIGVPSRDGQQEPWESCDIDLLNPSPARKLAIDIFAHWAVDGVWWIGGIGSWELGRVISFMRSQNWLAPPMYVGEHWWPESMYNVGKELRNLGAYEIM